MVFFSCDGCGEALKKQQVEKHRFRCRNSSFSCIDCSTVFPGDSYKEHIKCITEAQKVSGKNFQPKEAKGEMKQQVWTDQVQAAISAADVNDKRLRDLLENMKGYSNIPRKQAKFINFLKASLRVRDRRLADSAWEALSRAADNFRQQQQQRAAAAGAQPKADTAPDADVAPAPQQDATTSNGDAALEKKAKRKRKSSAGGDDAKATKAVKCDENDADDSQLSAAVFKWKTCIKAELKELLADKDRVKLKVLKGHVRKAYDASCAGENDFDSLFEKKLQSMKTVVVDGKFVSLA